MKHILLIMSLCIVCSSLTVAQGDSTLSPPLIHEVMLMTGISYPYLPADFRTHSMKGLDVGAGYSLTFAPGEFGYSTVSLVAEYGLFRFDESAFMKDLDTIFVMNTPGLEVKQRPVKAFTCMVNYRGTFSSLSTAFSPYFLIGLGYMYVSVPAILATPDTSINVGSSNLYSIAWSFGIGVDIPINDKAGIFVQAKSTLGAMDKTRQYFPIVIGLRYRL